MQYLAKLKATSLKNYQHMLYYISPTRRMDHINREEKIYDLQSLPVLIQQSSTPTTASIHSMTNHRRSRTPIFHRLIFCNTTQRSRNLGTVF